MTKAELRTLTRQLLEEYSTEAGSRLGSDNTILDNHIDSASVIVTLQLMEFDYISFLSYEDISLVKDQADYTLTADWVRIHCIQIPGSSTDILPYIQPEHVVTGSSATPTHWTLKARTITFYPTPSAAAANYARAWIHLRETDDLPDAGPTYIPSIVHRAIAFKAAESIMAALYEDAAPIKTLYDEIIENARPILGNKVVQLSQDREEA